MKTRDGRMGLVEHVVRGQRGRQRHRAKGANSGHTVNRDDTSFQDFFFSWLGGGGGD